MKKYSSIKQLVIDETISNGEIPSLEYLTALVKENFPNSKWQKSHYDWYRSQIKTGKIETGELLKHNDVEEEVNEITESITEFAVSLERDLQTYFSNRLNEIENGLTLVGIEYGTSAGFIDILAKDISGDYVVIELKAGKAKDAALGQILGYIGALIENGIQSKIRGILVASEFDNRIFYASKAISNISLLKYSLKFTLMPATIQT
jgi:RecB family endonuclease NucS